MKNNLLTILLLFGAIAAGIGGYLLTDEFIEGEVSDYKAELDSGLQLVEVVVASRDLVIGDKITNQSVSIRPMPKSYIHNDYIAPGAFNSIVGAQIAHAVAAGNPVLNSHLVRGSDLSFSDLVGKDKRAITIPVDSLDTVNGFLEPGDFVDLMITLSDGPQTRTLPLLGNVKVIATGTTLENDIDKEDRYGQITMGVSPVDAARILHAQTVGSINVLLRGAGSEDDFPAEDYITIENLLSSKQRSYETIEAVLPQPASLQVIRAGR